MAATAVRYGLHMRTSFDVAGLSVAQWFPGHMAKGLNEMQKKLKSVDCIIEVHDSRIPISGRNPIFENRLTAIKPHLLVMNKSDKIDHRHRSAIEQYYNAQGCENILFTNCKKPDSRAFRKVIPTITELISGSSRFNRAEEKTYQLMVIGIPNVGKSSLINALRAKHLRKSKASTVGGLPGITRSVLERIKVCDEPLIYLLDTPGVLAPKIKDVETGMKLAVAATIKDHLVGETAIADYLLFKLNSVGNHAYVDYLGVEEPTDDIRELLTKAAVRNNWFLKNRSYQGRTTMPDITISAAKFLSGFRAGKFGPLILDDMTTVPPLES